MSDLDRVREEIARAVRAGLKQPGPGFDQRLLDAVRTPPSAPRREPGRYLAAAASLALGILVVAGLLWTSPGVRARFQAPAARPGSAPTARPTATPAPTPTPTAFVYQSVRPPMVAYGPLLRASWSGASLPAIVVPQGLSSGMPSPDGRYITAQAGNNDLDFVDTATGAVVASSHDNSYDMWADDSLHMCSLAYSPAGLPSAIRIGALVPGTGVTPSTVPIVGLPANTGAFLATCSFRNDRALLMAVPGRSVYAVQLSTGHVVLSRQVPAGMTTFSALSPDGRLAAAASAPQSVADTSATRITTEVVDVDAGTVVAHLDGAVAGFSGDDQRAALSEGSTRAASVVELRTGRTIWTQPQRIVEPEGERSLPGGAAMALSIATQGGVPDLVLVRDDGSATVVATSAEVVTFGSVGAAG